jgi:hypothetical protein
VSPSAPHSTGYINPVYHGTFGIFAQEAFTTQMSRCLSTSNRTALSLRIFGERILIERVL